MVVFSFIRVSLAVSLNESPSEKEGKFKNPRWIGGYARGLNESPSEKEGKFGRFTALFANGAPQ